MVSTPGMDQPVTSRVRRGQQRQPFVGGQVFGQRRGQAAHITADAGKVGRDGTGVEEVAQMVAVMA